MPEDSSSANSSEESFSSDSSTESSEQSSYYSSSGESSSEPSSESSAESSSESSWASSSSGSSHSSLISSSSCELSIEAPSRIGISTANKDRSVEVTVSTPNCNPNNIQLIASNGADKVTIEALGVRGETSAKFKVTEIAPSAAEDDVTLEATCEGSTENKTLTVVVPTSVGAPRPLEQDFNVQAPPPSAK